MSRTMIRSLATVLILAFGLLLVMYVPSISTVLVDGDIQLALAAAEQKKEAPREAWLMQCVQEDRSNPRPCTEADKARFGEDGTKDPYAREAPVVPVPDPAKTAAPADDADDLMKQMMGDTPKSADDKAKGADDKAKDDSDELLREMMGDTPKGAASAAPSAKPSDPNEDLMKEMMGEKK